MASEVPEQALSKDQAIKAISKHPNKQPVVSAAECTVERVYDGEKVDATFLTRNISRTTELGPASVKPSVVSIEEIDKGTSGDPLEEYTGPSGNIETPQRVQSYSGVTDVQRTECPDCSGSGRTCTECSGSGTLYCNNCHVGMIEYKCGCRGRETNRGYHNKAVAGTGDILRTCTGCGGDGYRGNSPSSGIECDACNGQGAFVETCQNCGGDGIESREQCRRCEGRGKYTCEECDGAGNVDVCSTCKGEGGVNEQEVTEVAYKLTHKEHLVDADVPVEGHKDEIAWTQTETETITDGFGQLPVTADGGETVETIAAKLEYSEPVLYRAEIDLEDQTLKDEAETGFTVTTSALVSDEVIKNDGQFAATERGGVVSRYVFGGAYAIGTTIVGSAVLGVIASGVLSFILAFFIDFGVIGNPVSAINHPFSSDIRGLFFITAGVVSVLFAVIVGPLTFRQYTSKYNFKFVDES